MPTIAQVFFSKHRTKVLYFLPVLLGFASCWLLFSVDLSGFYKLFIFALGPKRLALGLMFIFCFIVLFAIFEAIELLRIESFTEQEINRLKNDPRVRKKVFTSSILVVALFTPIAIVVCNKYVVDWGKFCRNISNYLLYVFAWHSLIKAAKVWRAYGRFYHRFSTGQLSLASFWALVSLLVVGWLFFAKGGSPFSEIGILLVSLTALLVCLLLTSVLFLLIPALKEKVKKMSECVNCRIEQKDTPKENSQAYDQFTVLVIFSIIAKRITDVKHDVVDYPFVISKAFKIVCYEISLLTTCVFKGRLKEGIRSLLVVSLSLFLVIFATYSSDFRRMVMGNVTAIGVFNLLLDYVILPLGTVKVIFQILAIFVHKRATSISANYFRIGAFFSFVTATNLMINDHCDDNSVTMSIYKGILYIVLLAFVGMIEKKNLERPRGAKA